MVRNEMLGKVVRESMARIGRAVAGGTAREEVWKRADPEDDWLCSSYLRSHDSLGQETNGRFPPGSGEPGQAEESSGEIDAEAINEMRIHGPYHELQEYLDEQTKSATTFSCDKWHYAVGNPDDDLIGFLHVAMYRNPGKEDAAVAYFWSHDSKQMTRGQYLSQVRGVIRRLRDAIVFGTSRG